MTFKTYLVGGAVRDALMGVTEVSDMDYVVVGATHADMLERGYTNVGQSFPVYMDENGDQWALARRERKTGVGYTGFSVEFEQGSLNPNLTQKFAELGYDPEKEYPVQELIKVFQRIVL